MKKIFLLGFSTLCLCFVLSCDDDEESTAPLSKQEVSLYGKKYFLESGAIWKANKNIVTSPEEYIYKDSYTNSDGKQVTDKIVGYTSGKETFETGNFCVSLYEKGLEVDENLKKVIGKGAVFTFYLASPNTKKLSAGKYSYHNSKKAFTFVGLLSSAYSSFLTGDETIVPATITEGSLEVKNNGKQYTIIFNCKTSFGGELSGIYTGDFKQIPIQQKTAITSLYDLTIDGLSGQTLRKQTYFGNISTEKSLDDSYNNAFLYTQAGTTITAKKAQLSKEDIDIALHWNEQEEAFYFKAPIVMRSYLDHQADYELLCHTKYMYAPASFTEENFQNLSAEDLQFVMKEESVKLESTPFTPRFIFFQTGKNVKGVLRVKNLIPATWKLESQVPGIYTIEFLKNPGLTIDLKYFSSPEILLLR